MSFYYGQGGDLAKSLEWARSKKNGHTAEIPIIETELGKLVSTFVSRPQSSSQFLSISPVAVGKESWKKTGQFALECSVRNIYFQSVQFLALLDGGASAYGFVDTKFAHTKNLDLGPLTRPRYLRVFDGSESSAGRITHVAKTKLKMSGHTGTMVLFVTTLADFDIMLGLPWLQ